MAQVDCPRQRASLLLLPQLEEGRKERKKERKKEMFVFYLLGKHVAEEVDGVGNDQSATQCAGVAVGQVRNDPQ